MIQFNCPKCSKQHIARDATAGRKGFCSCGAILSVPGSVRGRPSETTPPPSSKIWKLIAFLSIAAGLSIAVAVYFVFFYHAWERANTPRLMEIAKQAELRSAAGRRVESVQLYRQLIEEVGSHEIADPALLSKIEGAQSSISSWSNDQEQSAKNAAAEKEAASRPPPILVVPLETEAGSVAPKTEGMTYENYLKMKDGMHSYQVNHLLDNYSPVEDSSSGDLQTVTYTAPGGAQVIATFRDDKLVSKMQFGLK